MHCPVCVLNAKHISVYVYSADLPHAEARELFGEIEDWEEGSPMKIDEVSNFKKGDVVWVTRSRHYATRCVVTRVLKTKVVCKGDDQQKYEISRTTGRLLVGSGGMFGKLVDEDTAQRAIGRGERREKAWSARRAMQLASADLDKAINEFWIEWGERGAWEQMSGDQVAQVIEVVGKLRANVHELTGIISAAKSI